MMLQRFTSLDHSFKFHPKILAEDYPTLHTCIFENTCHIYDIYFPTL